MFPEILIVGNSSAENDEEAEPEDMDMNYEVIDIIEDEEEKKYVSGKLVQ